MNDIHDVVIIGAGPGGSATAHYLAKEGLDVVLLDKAEFPRDKTCGDGLTPRALWVLKDMGIYDQVADFAYRINGLELNGSMGNMLVAPFPESNLYPDHMLIAPRFQLDEIILQRALKSGAAFLGGVRVRGVDQYEDHGEVLATSLGAEVKINGRIIILAVGANFSLLSKMGITKRKPSLILGARGYYEGLEGISDRVVARVADVPLPGYGCVFPISETAANIGIGFWGSWLPWNKPPSSARNALDHFLAHSPRMKRVMKRAQINGKIQGFPLRVDFASAPTYSGRILLVGESAGLVSPMTGEGFYFALESGKIAAGFVSEKFDVGTLSTIGLAEYDQVLRGHFQRLFIFLSRIRQLYINPFLMNRAILAARKFPEIEDILVKVTLGQEDAASMLRLSVVRKIVLGV